MVCLPGILIYVEYLEKHSILRAYAFFYSTCSLAYLVTVISITFIPKIQMLE